MKYISKLVDIERNMPVNYTLNYRGRTDYKAYISDTESRKIIICDLADIENYNPEGIFCDFANVLTKAEIKLAEGLDINHSLVPEKDAKIVYLTAQCVKVAWKYQDASKILRADTIKGDIDYIVIKYTAGVETVIPYTEEFIKLYNECRVLYFKKRFRLGYI